MGRFGEILVRSLVVCALFVSQAKADDWPRWLGAEGDSIWREKGVVESMPARQLDTQWRLPVGQGYSTPSVVNGVVYLTDFIPSEKKGSDNPGTQVALSGSERVMAIDAKSGKVLWTHAYPEQYTISYANGPRVQPTVKDGQIYTIGAQGRFLALEAKSGKVLWEKKLTEEYKTPPPQWGYASHPLVDGDLVFANAGNADGAAVAFDRKTGKQVWQGLPAKELGYGPPSMIEHKGKKQLLIFHSDSLNSVDPLTGELNWTEPIAPDHGMAISPPRKVGNLLFVSGAPRHSMVLRLTDREPQPVWHLQEKKGIHSANATPFIQDGIIYGTDALSGSFRAVRLLDGEQLWESFKPTTGVRRAPYGTAFIVRNESNKHFYIFAENGDLIIADMDAKGYKEIGRQHLVEPTSDAFGREVAWSHPAFADGSVFVRNDKELVRFDLSKASYPDGGRIAGQDEAIETHQASLEEAGTHILNMTRLGVNAFFDLTADKERAKQFTKNDLWTKVDVATVHNDVFPSINYLYSFFPDNYAALQKGTPSKAVSQLGSAIGALFGSKPKGTKEFIASESFLDGIEKSLSRLEGEYRSTNALAKDVQHPDGADFSPTKEKWYPARTDKDTELWRVFSEVAALEYYLYRVSEVDIDLAQKYKTEVSVRVRDPNSKKKLEDYFGFSQNPKRAIDLARRLARLEKAHLSRFGLYTPLRELLVRFLSYHWEFHDLLLPEADVIGRDVPEPSTHSAGDK